MRAVLVVMALVAAALAAGLGGGVAGAAGTMTVTPSTGLIDGQAVHVSATGLGANTGWAMEQCVQNHLIEGCDPSTATYGGTDASGNFSTDVAVRTILHTQIGTIDCRTNAEACVLGASTTGGPTGAVSAVLGFDPSGPLLPPPVVHATPDTGLIDAQTVAVDGTGFRPGSTYLEIRQCTSGATQVSQCHSGSYQNYYPVNPDGSFHSSTRVHGLLATDGGAIVDCRLSPTACVLMVGTFYDGFDAVAAAIAFDPDAPALPPALITANPSTGLIDGQTTTVTGTGFLANSPVGISQCATSSTSMTCSGGTFVYTDGNGDLSVPLAVRARLWAGEILDCRDPSVDCSLQAYSYEDSDQHSVTPITFDPNGPLLPPPTMTATPSTGLVDGQVVSLNGTGIVYPYGTVVSVPVTDRRHPDARWVAPATTQTSAWGAATVPATSRPRTNLAAQPFQISIAECVTTPVFDISGCDPQTYSVADVDSAGVLTGTAQVWAVFNSFDGRSVDCRTATDACSLYTVFGDPLTSAIASIDFDPNGPLAPPPSLTVTPTTGLVDHQEMHVVGDGFPANTLVSLHQCQADQSGLDGCDTDLYAVVVTDNVGHIDLTTVAKRIIGLGTDGDPYSRTFDCASAPGACRLTFADYKPVSDWPSVTLTYATSATPPAAPPPAQVVVQPQFTG
ncbi:MAG: neocarzinostatin apoprotein domain-containing protein [Acidimicrobiales bacterium]